MFTIYTDDYIKMNGEGITQIKDDNADFFDTVDEGLQAIDGTLSEYIFEYTNPYYEFSIYFEGNDLRIDYKCLDDDTEQMIVLNTINEWINKNVQIIKEG